MRPTSFVVVLCCLAVPIQAHAQSRETVDLATFDLPSGWTKKATTVGTDFTLQEPAAKSACVISVMNALPGTADPKQNFATTWAAFKGLVSEDPTISAVTTKNSWSTIRGQAPYKNSSGTGVMTLVSSSGFGVAVNFVITTNNPKRYATMIEKILTSVTFKQPGDKPSATATPAPAPAPAQSAASLVGTWGRGSSVTSSGGSFGRYRYTKQQYTFTANGQYAYIRKNYVEDDKETYLIFETGTYSVSGDTITIAPTSNVIEAWSKRNGGDTYKERLTVQKLALEKVTYHWVIAPFPELKESDLVLLADKETVRDGAYNATNAFPKGWRLSPTTLANPSYTAIKLPDR